MKRHITIIWDISQFTHKSQERLRQIRVLLVWNFVFLNTCIRKGLWLGTCHFGYFCPYLTSLNYHNFMNITDIWKRFSVTSPAACALIYKHMFWAEYIFISSECTGDTVTSKSMPFIEFRWRQICSSKIGNMK